MTLGFLHHQAAAGFVRIGPLNTYIYVRDILF